MAVIIQNRRDTAANWTANNPTLAHGEIGFEQNVGATSSRFKVGNGVDAWNDLDYFSEEATTIASSGGSIIVSQNGTSFNLEVASAPIQNHNNLSGLQGSGSDYYHLNATQFASISGGIDLSNYTLLSTTSSISGNLQSQINLKANSSDLSNYTTLATTAAISGNLQAQISAITVPTSATFLSDYDNRYVNVSGDTMTGPLVINYDNPSVTGASLQVNADGDARIRLNNPSGNQVYSELSFANSGVDRWGIYVADDGEFGIYNYLTGYNGLEFKTTFTNLKSTDGKSIIFGEGDGGYIFVNVDQANIDTVISTKNNTNAFRVSSDISGSNEQITCNIPLHVNSIAGTNGNIVTHDANGKLLDSGINISTLSQQASGGGLVENIDFFLAAGSNSTIVLRANCKYPFTLNDITDETSSGTITGNVRKNGVSVGGLDALSFTSTPTTTNATSGNSFVAGDKLDIVFTSNSSSLNVAGSIKITRV